MRRRTANAAAVLTVVLAVVLALSGAFVLGAGRADAQVRDTIPTFTADEFVAFLDRVELPGTTGPGPVEAITGYGPADARIIGRAEATDYRLRRRAAVPLTGQTGVLLNGEASAALGAMAAAAATAGAPFAPVSGFRSVDDQRGIFISKLVSEGFGRIGRPYNLAEIASGAADAAIDEVLRLNSIPGYSFHHTGDTVDLAAPGQSLDSFSASRAYAWLTADDYANAKAFGFVPSYPVGASAIGPEPEPWEFTYVGTGRLQCAQNVLRLVDRTPGSCPVGSLDGVGASGTTVTVSGWAADADDPGRALEVHLYADGRGVAVLVAGGSRPDVDAVTGLGAGHGFVGSVGLAPGAHEVCAYGINDVTSEQNTLLGCRTVVVRSSVPDGALDVVVSSGTGAFVQGWAADRDLPGSVLDVHVYVDGIGTGVLRAGDARPDVDAATGWGPAHGFSGRLPVPGGVHQVCAYAISPQPAEGNPLIGCRTAWFLGSSPTGVLDAVTAVGRSVVVQGWALDGDLPDTPVDVHVYVDGVGAAAVSASGARPDVGAAFAVGSDHGFAALVATADGRHTVCAYAVAVQPGDPNVLLGCRDVVTGGRAPVGALDGADGLDGGRVRVSGWSADPDRPEVATDVHVYIDGQGVAAVPAGGVRPDVAAATPFGAAHGFDVVLPVAPGRHEVCAYGISPEIGEGNSLLGCRAFTL